MDGPLNFTLVLIHLHHDLITNDLSSMWYVAYHLFYYALHREQLIKLLLVSFTGLPYCYIKIPIHKSYKYVDHNDSYETRLQTASNK